MTENDENMTPTEMPSSDNRNQDDGGLAVDDNDEGTASQDSHKVENDNDEAEAATEDRASPLLLPDETRLPSTPTPMPTSTAAAPSPARTSRSLPHTFGIHDDSLVSPHRHHHRPMCSSMTSRSAPASIPSLPPGLGLVPPFNRRSTSSSDRPELIDILESAIRVTNAVEMDSIPSIVFLPNVAGDTRGRGRRSDNNSNNNGGGGADMGKRGRE